VTVDVAHFSAPVNAKVVVLEIVRTPIIVVDRTTVGVAVTDDEVVVNLIHSRAVRRSTSGHGGEVSLPVPRIYRAMVTRLTASVE
jgi:hypothetical protein